jgi:hypothetical protein
VRRRRREKQRHFSRLIQDLNNPVGDAEKFAIGEESSSEEEEEKVGERRVN